MDALDVSDYIIMYFDPNTKSKISLIEFGLYANSGKLMICCPDGFWAKGNIDIYCKRYGIAQYNSLDEIINSIREDIN